MFCIDWLPLCAVYFGFYICSYAHPFSTPQEQLESVSPGLAELCPVVLYCTHLGCRPSSSHSTPRAVDCGCTRLLCIWFASLRVSHYFFVSSSSFNVYIKLFHLSILYIYVCICIGKVTPSVNTSGLYVSCFGSWALQSKRNGASHQYMMLNV